MRMTANEYIGGNLDDAAHLSKLDDINDPATEF